MPKAGPAGAEELLPTVLAIDSQPRPATEWLKVIILSEGWASSPIQAAELAARWEKPFLKRLRRAYGHLTESGRVCQFSFNTSSDYVLQGAAFIEQGVDSAEVKEAKRRRARLKAYVEMITELTPTEFEWLCRGILREMGATCVCLTPATGDEGIDFYGRLPLQALLAAPPVFPSVWTQLEVWLVGQAKHYRMSQVATPEIRELVGSVTLARARTFSEGDADKYSGLSIKVCEPVYFLFFTTGLISADGWRLLQRSGVVGMDGMMVADFLAGRGIALDGSGCPGEAELIAWVRNHGPGRGSTGGDG